MTRCKIIRMFRQIEAQQKAAGQVRREQNG